MKIEILYIEGCRNAPATVDRVNEILREQALGCPVCKISVDDHERAMSFRFLGSPTVRIDGVDIEPTARQRSRTDFGIMCRTYDGSGIPSEELIRRAITEALPASSRSGNAGE